MLFAEMRIDPVHKSDGDEGGKIRCSRCGEVGHMTVRGSEQVCGLSVAKRIIWRKAATLSSLSLACEENARVSDDKTSVAKKKRLSSVMYQASISRRLVRRFVLRLLRRWDTSR